MLGLGEHEPKRLENLSSSGNQKIGNWRNN